MLLAPAGGVLAPRTVIGVYFVSSIGNNHPIGPLSSGGFGGTFPPTNLTGPKSRGATFLARGFVDVRDFVVLCDEAGLLFFVVGPWQHLAGSIATVTIRDKISLPHRDENSSLHAAAQRASPTTCDNRTFVRSAGTALRDTIMGRARSGDVESRRCERSRRRRRSRTKSQGMPSIPG